MPQDGHGTPHDRAAHKVNDEQPAQNTGRGQSGFNDDRDLQGDGQFVNFEVDFSFDGRENKNAWSLRFICYMGFGLKGIGGTELRGCEVANRFGLSLESNLSIWSLKRCGST
jgi:hypothetical protein